MLMTWRTRKLFYTSKNNKPMKQSYLNSFGMVISLKKRPNNPEELMKVIVRKEGGRREGEALRKVDVSEPGKRKKYKWEVVFTDEEETGSRYSELN